MLPVVFEQANALTTFGDRPLAVLTSSEQLETEGWGAAQERIASLSTNTLHRTVQATHAGVVEDPSGATESARAIASVIQAVRDGSTVTAP